MKPKTNVSSQIKSLSNTFNNNEEKIANYIINYPIEVINSTISEVADAIDLSDASIFRFSKKLGFKGFQELKINLAQEINPGRDHFNKEEIHENDDNKTIIAKIFNENIATINATIEAINLENFNKAVDAIVNANEIVFLGSGGSRIVAEDAHHKFIRTGLNVSTYVDYHLQLMAVAQLSKDDVVIVISHTGSNLNMLEVLDIANDIGATTISITSYLKSPISDNVDIPLNVISQETKYQFEAFSSRIAHLSLLDALYVSVILKKKDKAKKSLEKMRDSIASTRL